MLYGTIFPFCFSRWWPELEWYNKEMRLDGYHPWTSKPEMSEGITKTSTHNISYITYKFQYTFKLLQLNGCVLWLEYMKLDILLFFAYWSLINHSKSNWQNGFAWMLVYVAMKILMYRQEIIQDDYLTTVICTSIVIMVYCQAVGCAWHCG